MQAAVWLLLLAILFTLCLGRRWRVEVEVPSPTTLTHNAIPFTPVFHNLHRATPAGQPLAAKAAARVVSFANSCSHCVWFDGGCLERFHGRRHVAHLPLRRPAPSPPPSA
ncbi:hypothetical protein PSPO01_09740 [Paraphaeosphaeria sporulosa]